MTDTEEIVVGRTFQFEATVEVRESDYAALQRLMPVSRRSRAILLGIGLLGVVLVFAGRWTAAVGGVLVLAVIVFWFTPQIGQRGVHQEYSRARYLHGPVTYGVGDRGIWFYGGALRAECTWPGLAVWERRDDSLLLGADGMPRVVLSVSKMREAGVYESVLELVQTHGVLFGSPQAYAQVPRPAT